MPDCFVPLESRPSSCRASRSPSGEVIAPGVASSARTSGAARRSAAAISFTNSRGPAIERLERKRFI